MSRGFSAIWYTVEELPVLHTHDAVVLSPCPQRPPLSKVVPGSQSHSFDPTPHAPVLPWTSPRTALWPPTLIEPPLVPEKRYLSHLRDTSTYCETNQQRRINGSPRPLPTLPERAPREGHSRPVSAFAPRPLARRAFTTPAMVEWTRSSPLILSPKPQNLELCSNLPPHQLADSARRLSPAIVRSLEAMVERDNIDCRDEFPLADEVQERPMETSDTPSTRSSSDLGYSADPIAELKTDHTDVGPAVVNARSQMQTRAKVIEPITKTDGRNSPAQTIIQQPSSDTRPLGVESHTRPKGPRRVSTSALVRGLGSSETGLGMTRLLA